MTRRELALIAGLALAFALACGPKRIPPGTPPPEYERPVLTPWSPPAGSAEPVGTEEPGSEPPLEPDAGSVDAGAAPASDASPTQQEF
jgi:hypothetical protein